MGLLWIRRRLLAGRQVELDQVIEPSRALARKVRRMLLGRPAAALSLGDLAHPVDERDCDQDDKSAGEGLVDGVLQVGLPGLMDASTLGDFACIILPLPRHVNEGIIRRRKSVL